MREAMVAADAADDDRASRFAVGPWWTSVGSQICGS